MADFVLDAAAVGQVVTYVAPGFLFRLGYRARYPGPDGPPGEVLIVAVVTSLPLVALVGALLPGEQKATQFGYIAALLAVGLVLGYVVAFVRGTQRGKKLLERFDYRLQPEGTIYAQTLQHMTPTGTVVVELKDGRRLWGCPRSGPATKDDGVAELYLTYRQAQTEDGDWVTVGSGVIVPLAEVSTITLSEEPTGAETAA